MVQLCLCAWYASFIYCNFGRAWRCSDSRYNGKNGTKRYMHHIQWCSIYLWWSRTLRGPGVFDWHGALAERALEPVLLQKQIFHMLFVWCQKLWVQMVQVHGFNLRFTMSLMALAFQFANQWLVLPWSSLKWFERSFDKAQDCRWKFWQIYKM